MLQGFAAPLPVSIAVIRYLHIAFGFVAFFAAPGALATRKGGKAHRLWGRIFFWAICGTTALALILGAWRPNYFLFLIALFSFYLAFSGYRILYRKMGQPATWFDWLVTVVCLVASVLLCVMSIAKPVFVRSGVDPVLSIFGLIGTVGTVRDIRLFLHKYDPKRDRMVWMRKHIGNMLGAYIAALTAFSATTLHFIPPILRWLWPTFLFVPVIVYNIRKYKTRDNTGNV